MIHLHMELILKREEEYIVVVHRSTIYLHYVSINIDFLQVKYEGRSNLKVNHAIQSSIAIVVGTLMCGSRVARATIKKKYL